MAGQNANFSKPYKEKLWFKPNGGEKITTGYSLRGRQRLKSSVEGLIKLFKRGAEKNIEGVELKILDTRIVGVALEIEVGIFEKGESGIAMLKLYGPYSQQDKKDNVIMISKVKHYDEKFVTILAEQVIKPLIVCFVKEENDSEEVKQPANVKSVSVKGKQIKVIKCPYCEKTSHSSPGLKIHITKMHQNIRAKESFKEDEIGKEANKIINLLQENNLDTENIENVETNSLEDCLMLDEEIVCQRQQCEFQANNIQNFKTHFKMKHVSRCQFCDKQFEGEAELNDHLRTQHTTENEKYEKKCFSCNFTAKAPRKYAAMQLIRKHKGSCTSCPECEFVGKDNTDLRKHLRDQHEILSESLSPPRKRKRKLEESKVIESEPMETEEVVDLSTSLEDMEIDDNETKLMRERSEKMDAKVIEKQKSTEIEDFLRRKKEASDENKRKKDENDKIAQEINKKRKQSEKDARKRKNKKNKKNKEFELPEAYKVPNIREIPSSCKHLVKKNDVLYVVPGDGCCGPNCAAAHLFKDEVYGPKLRRKMNEFVADHFNDGRYEFISNCSPENPFIRKLKGKEIKFTDQKMLIKFLRESEEAAYMWTENEDLAILSDMYQMKIKIITINRNDSQEAIENWIYPDPELKQFSEFQNVEIDDLVLIHENDNHFNLVVDKDSDLAQCGSLSFRFNVGPILTKEENIETSNKKQEEEKVNDELELDKVKEELKKCQKSKSIIEEKYIKCEKELKLKTEEAVKLKLEKKDLQEIVNLLEISKENESRQRVENKRKTCPEQTEKAITCENCGLMVQDDNKQKEHMDQKHGQERKPRGEHTKFPNTSLEQDLVRQRKNNVIKCQVCGKFFEDERDLQEHKNREHYVEEHPKHSQKQREEEFNCMECDFQTDSAYRLQKHINLKHFIKCKFCGNLFQGKETLMKHRKSHHPSAVAKCLKFIKGECFFSAENCWWIHTINSEESSNKSDCYICGKTFQSRTEVMKHRKSMHPSVVKLCEMFKQLNCKYENEACWFLHETKELEGSQECLEGMKDNQVFQKDQMSPKPPYIN